MIEITDIQEEKILVMGIGGAGNNAVNRMIEFGTTEMEGLEGIEFIAINTDRQALKKSLASNTIAIGEKSTRGLGAGGNPEVGQIAAEESREELSQVMENFDMVFITAGMGGGTGTGAAVIVAEIAKSQDILTIAIVTKPFNFEGRKRALNAIEGIEKLKERVDTLVVIPNERILDIIEDDTSQIEAFYKVDEILRQGVTSIASIIMKPAFINVDFADVKNIMKDKGYAHLGVGRGSGKTKVKDALNEAINSPLLETSIERAKSGLVYVVGGSTLGLREVAEGIGSTVMTTLHESANIIYGTGVEDDMKDEVIITIIITDLKGTNDEEIEKEKKVLKQNTVEQNKSIELNTDDTTDDNKEIETNRRTNIDFKLDIPQFLRGKK